MKKKSINRSEIDRYKGWLRILPSNEFEGYDSFYKAKKIFDKLIAKRGATISSSKFSKLAKIKGMTNS